MNAREQLQVNIDDLQENIEDLETDLNTVADYESAVQDGISRLEDLKSQLERCSELVCRIEDDETDGISREDLLAELEMVVADVEHESGAAVHEIEYLQEQGIHTGFLGVNEISIDGMEIYKATEELYEYAKEEVEKFDD